MDIWQNVYVIIDLQGIGSSSCFDVCEQSWAESERVISYCSGQNVLHDD